MGSEANGVAAMDSVNNRKLQQSGTHLDSPGTVGELVIHPEDAGSVGKLAKLQPTQQAGLWLAIGVGFIISAVIIVLLIDLFSKSPSMPSGWTQMEPEKAKVAIDNIKILNDLAVDRSIKLFDTIVARSLLPVFTAILGYIFGSRPESK